MLKTGDIVRLKSGGPAMTVDKVNNSKISCVWFKEEHLKSAIFRKDTLERCVAVESFPKTTANTHANKQEPKTRTNKPELRAVKSVKTAK